MTRVVRFVGAIAVVALLATLPIGVAAGEPANAPSGADGPHISLSASEVNPGDPVLVSMRGFKAFSVTVAMCGNLAKRGSADCAMASSQGQQISPYEDVTVVQLVVQPPPTTCPCIIRAVSTLGDEFAVAPITLVGHPVGPLLGVTSGPLVAVKVQSTRLSGGPLGSLRSALGGKTKYSVTVAVRNLTTETLSSVALAGSVGNALNDDAAKLPLQPPGPIEPGQTWTQTMDVEIPAPVIGSFTWTVTAYGAGESVAARQRMSTLPLLLYLLAAVFVGDLALLGWRLLRRIRERTSTVAPLTTA